MHFWTYLLTTGCHVGISDVDFLPKGTRFRQTFWLRVYVFDACGCPSWSGRVVDISAQREGPQERGGSAFYRSELPFLWQGPMEISNGTSHCLAACFDALERRRLSVAVAIGCLVTSPPVFATHFSPSPPYPLMWTVIPPTSISLSSSPCHLSSRFLPVINPHGSRTTDIK